MKEAVIATLGRSAIGKAPNGKLKYTRPDDIGAQVVKGVLARVPQLDLQDIEDIIMGCAIPEGVQGLNAAKIIGARAGLPDCVPAQTINRFCSSGLQSIALAANSIMTGQMDIVLAGGVESMSMVPAKFYPNPYLMQNKPELYIAMGLTAENVAQQYKVTRDMQDAFAAESHRKAAKALAEGKFKAEIIPVEAVTVRKSKEGRLESENFLFDTDEGIRPDSTSETLAKLKPSFMYQGTVTAGNSSQTSDGAAAVLLMSADKARDLGIKPLARFMSFGVAGVAPELMGIGPIKAIPKALRLAGLSKDDLDLIELNEAFASQAIAVINELELDAAKVNVNGGAIALGHPLGATGSVLTAKLINELRRTGGRYGLVSMCIGMGMGAAAVFEYIGESN